MKGASAFRSVMLATAMLGFAGAQRSVSTADVSRPLAFDPFALLRRPPTRENRRSRSTWPAHCGAKQTRKYAAQISADAFNVHFDRRMAWLAANQHVTDIREYDQERARSEDGGRNAIMWGRRR